jgi:CDP-diacylglycerol--serine O-phosphatidyltransferase
MSDVTKFTRHIPNTATLLNLFSGFISILLTAEGNLILGSWFIFIALFFDFSDGFLARMLKAYSELGKQLDSLADLVSFGVAPALLFFKAFQIAFETRYGVFSLGDLQFFEQVVMISPVLLVVTSALRLGKFNIDPDQEDTFIGLPTPATGVFIASYMLIAFGGRNEGLIHYLDHPVFLLVLTILFSLLMISKIPMFSLKFHSFSWKENRLRYVFIGISLILVILIKMLAIPAVILLYISISAGIQVVKKNT